MSEPTMVRKQVYITRTQNRALAEQAHRSGRSQSALIREAIDAITRDRTLAGRREAVRRVAGLWKDRTDLPDLDALRRENEVRLSFLEDPE